MCDDGGEMDKALCCCWIEEAERERACLHLRRA